MKTKIVDVLLDYFGSVYCHSCESQESGQYCDECHRKAMNWGISEAYAEIVADNILKQIMLPAPPKGE